MTDIQAKELVQNLQKIGIEFEVWLTNDEVLKIEEKFNFKFPPDLKYFLQTNLPVSEWFYNWRNALDSQEITEMINSQLQWPLEGINFDIEYNNFWVKNWGKKPENLEEQLIIAENNFKGYPKLIPIYSHRFIPMEPNIIDNPIFSVYQTDIIFYGYNLADYLSNEFKFTISDNFEVLMKPKHDIEFWTWCVEKNN